ARAALGRPAAAGGPGPRARARARGAALRRAALQPRRPPAPPRPRRDPRAATPARTVGGLRHPRPRGSPRRLRPDHRDGPRARRPDAIALGPVGADGGIAGRISRCAFVGHAVEYVIETAAGELLAVAPPGAPTRPIGWQVTLALGWRGVALVE